MIEICKYCNDSFIRPGRKKDNSKNVFCSPKCYSSYKKAHLEEYYKIKAYRHKITCKYCGKEFISYRPDAKFCNNTCFHASLKDNPTHDTRIEMKCDNCNRILKVSKSDRAYYNSHFCDAKCHAEWQSKNTSEHNHHAFLGFTYLICKQCGIEIKRKISIHHSKYMEGRNPFCSLSCRSKWVSENMSKEKSPHYNRKLSIEIKNKISATLIGKNTGTESVNWRGGRTPHPVDFYRIRKSILSRDKHICSICGKEGDNVHHIDYNKDNNEEYNLTTLCHTCHSATNIHNRYFWISFFNYQVQNNSLWLK